MASCIRRKPIVTYKSPSADDHACFTISLTSSNSKQSSSTTPISGNVSYHPNPYPKNNDLLNASRHKYSMATSLPLFHPFGRLAMSLPPLDPTRYGLPMPAILADIDSKSSFRARRPVEKLREVDEDPAPTSPTVSSIAAVAAREVKGPRKRRNGGAKRKRKDADDGDATYPAKKMRMPRGAAGQGADDDLLIDGGPINEPEPVAEPLPQSRGASKRTTRSRGSLKRRDSSASETTSVAGSPKANSDNTGGDTLATSNIVDTEAPPPSGGYGADPLNGNGEKEEKEEGELSEGHLNP